MKAEFEEKTYENYFNAELARLTNIFFPLGQVQEGFLGFDCAAFTTDRNLWKILGYPFWFFNNFEGVSFRRIAQELESILEYSITNIPPMKFNLLFQYKRPEYISKPRGIEWTYWKNPYYRYDIYQKQQTLLMQIDNQLGTKILVVYASPAIHDVHELVQAYLDNKVIKFSNFCKASELNGHHRNTFTKAGKFSIACSKSEKINNFYLIKTINEMNDKSNIFYKDNIKFIIDFRDQIISIMNENQYYSKSFNDLKNRYNKFEQYELLYSFLILIIFRLLTGTQWLVKI